jgi:pheromone shutdown protein TraB
MGWFSSLFTKPEKVLDMASGVGGWIDEQQFTDEEKSEFKLKLFEQKLRWLQATQGMNLARRFIALAFVGNFIVTFQLCLWTWFAGFIFEFETKVFLEGVVDLAVAFNVGWIMVTIVVFYFGKVADVKGALFGKAEKQ